MVEITSKFALAFELLPELKPVFVNKTTISEQILIFKMFLTKILMFNNERLNLILDINLSN